MSEGYVKLFGSILDSTVWQEDSATRLVWITMLAMANRDGIVSAAVPGLAVRARVSIADCETALAKFMAPDPYSRSADFEGRRIEKVDGGWRLLNSRKYREKLSKIDQDEKHALRQREYRKRHGASRSVTRDGSDYIAEAEADTKAKAEAEGKRETPRARRGPTKHTLPEGFCLTPGMQAYAASKRSWTPEKTVSVFEDFVGKAQARGYRYADWVKAWESWVRDEGKFDPPTGTYRNGKPQSRSEQQIAIARKLIEDAKEAS